jgi:hypothetical protein
VRKFINGIMVIGLAMLLVWAANQATTTKAAGWYLLLGVQIVFFILAVVQAIASKEM